VIALIVIALLAAMGATLITAMVTGGAKEDAYRAGMRRGRRDLRSEPLDGFWVLDTPTAEQFAAGKARIAELAALKARRCTSCEDEAECTVLTAVCEHSDWEIEDSFQFACCLHSDDRAERSTP